MKNLIIIIGTILLGALIVNTLVLGDDNSLKSAAGDIMEEGTKAIMDSIDFSGAGSGSTGTAGETSGNSGGNSGSGE